MLGAPKKGPNFLSVTVAGRVKVKKRRPGKGGGEMKTEAGRKREKEAVHS